MFRTILVPLDGSRFGEHALPWALALAGRTGAAIHLVHVHHVVPFTEMEAVTPYQYEGITLTEYEHKVSRQEHGYLGDVEARVRAATQVPVSAALLEGKVVAAVECYGRDVGADLIVMSTHGRTGLSRAWLGSVADGLVRHTTVPALLLRPRNALPDLEAEPRIERILIPLDGSTGAEQGLHPALALGDVLGARLTLLRAVCTHTVKGGRDYRIPSGHVEERRAEAAAYLEGVAARLRRRGVGVDARVAVAAAPARAILHSARAVSADLIAMATHGYGGITRMVLGSVADKVLRAAAQPVLLTRPAEA